MTRAIKIIEKSMTNEEEQQRLINEVNILKKLVSIIRIKKLNRFRITQIS